MGRFQESQAPQSHHHRASSLPSKSGRSDLSPSLTPSPTCLPLASHLSSSHPANGLKTYFIKLSSITEDFVNSHHIILFEGHCMLHVLLESMRACMVHAVSDSL